PPDRGHERAQVERSGLLVASGERQGIREPHFAIPSGDHLQKSPMQRLLASVTIVLLLGMVINPRPADEKKRDQGDAFRPDRQEGLPHPPICFLLLIHRVCRRVRFAHGESAAILLFRGPLLGRRIPLRSGVVAVPAQPGILREKFSRWHRRRPSRQTHYNRPLCAFSQSHLYSVLDHPAWQVLRIPKLASLGRSWPRHLVVPPSSAARRNIPNPTLWQGILGVLCSRKEIHLSRPQGRLTTRHTV